MTWENRGTFPATLEFPVDLVMPAFLARLVRRPVPSQPSVRPWQWERLATPEEIARLRKTDLRRAA
jgi:hypothetical protein